MNHELEMKKEQYTKKHRQEQRDDEVVVAPHSRSHCPRLSLQHPSTIDLCTMIHRVLTLGISYYTVRR